MITSQMFNHMKASNENGCIIPVRAGYETAASIAGLIISVLPPDAVIDAAPSGDSRRSTDDPGGVRYNHWILKRKMY